MSIWREIIREEIAEMEREDRIKQQKIDKMDNHINELMKSVGEQVYDYGYNINDDRYYNIKIDGKRGWYTYKEIINLINSRD